MDLIYSIGCVIAGVFGIILFATAVAVSITTVAVLAIVLNEEGDEPAVDGDEKE